MELKPFFIGNVKVEFPIVLAPMAGFTDLAYRVICRRLGVAYCTTEMILDRILLVDKLRRKLLPIDPSEHPLGGQILGNDPAVMAEAARALCRLGFDVVDLNFACPVRKALGRRRGGFMMSVPQRTAEIVQAVMAVVDRPVSIKVRRAFLEADPAHDAFWRIADAAFDAGVASICVHGRSVEMKYKGRADWQFIAEVKRRYPDKTIVGSGDILTPPDALRMLKETGVDGVSVARGALGNPWFFRQARDLAEGRQPYQPSLAEQRELLARHFMHSMELYTRKAHKVMRGFGIKYARLHPTPAKVRAAFVNIKHMEDWQAVLDQFYAAPGPAGASVAAEA